MSLVCSMFDQDIGWWNLLALLSTRMFKLLFLLYPKHFLIIRQQTAMGRVLCLASWTERTYEWLELLWMIGAQISNKGNHDCSKVIKMLIREGEPRAHGPRAVCLFHVKSVPTKQWISCLERENVPATGIFCLIFHCQRNACSLIHFHGCRLCFLLHGNNARAAGRCLLLLLLSQKL